MITPSTRQWRAMTLAQRETFVAAAIEASVREAELMGEGRRHNRSKVAIGNVLGDFIQRTGRPIYLASELVVLYPGEATFCPDLLAVRDVEDPRDDDPRMAWIVDDEGCGIDLAVEVLYGGDRHKDLVRNVAWYARLGIPEYIVYDRMRQRLYGYRLPAPDATTYVSMRVHDLGFWSEVLSLGVGILGGRLRFFHEDGALVPETSELLARANGLIRDVQDRFDTAERRAAEAEDRAAEVERRAAEVERRAAEAEDRAAEAEDRAAQVERRAAEAEDRAAALEAELAALRARLGET